MASPDARSILFGCVVYAEELVHAAAKALLERLSLTMPSMSSLCPNNNVMRDLG